MQQQTLGITVSRLIAAPAERIYAVLSEVPNLARLSPENVSSEWIDPGDRAVAGRRFRGTNQIKWVRWTTKPVITEADPGRRLAFRVPSGALTTWTYDLVETESGTRVTESMRTERPMPAIVVVLMRLTGVTDRAEALRAGMTETLARLAENVEQSAPDPARTSAG